VTSAAGPHVTVLGTGVMGAAMSRSLLRAGLPVTVWNRDPAKAAPLAADGATVAADVATALRDAEVVVTMLFDAGTVREVVLGPVEAGSWPDGAVWLQTTTTGVEGTADLLALAAAHGIDFVDAPVMGSKGPAEAGALTVLCAGPQRLEAVLAPVLDAVGARTLWVGQDAGRASALKLVCNAWIITMTDAVAQSVALAEGLGLDPRLFLDAVGTGATNSPYLQSKGAAMADGSTAGASFALGGARKDVGLVLDALRSAGVDPRLAEAVLAHLEAADVAGYGRHDMAAVVHGLRQGS
jgi:3-hydroxyisobutyrate dehydrogenase